MPKVRDVLTKVYNLCRTQGFVYEQSCYLSEGRSTVLNYGPLGTEIKRNFFNEWWHEIVTSRGNVYGIDLGLQTRESTYLQQTYNHACKLIENQDRENPTGLAQHLTISKDSNDEIDKFMFASQRKEFYKLCFFCPSNKLKYWMDYWIAKRLSWWKKYADIPAGFFLIDKDCRNEFIQNHNDEATLDTVTVQFNFPWGKEAVESISSYPDIRQLIKNESDLDAHLAVVLATVSAERGILAYLLDAYHENKYLDSHGVQTTHNKLRLHPAIAPVKVAILYSNASNVDLGRLSQQLASELRQAGMTTQCLEVEQNGDMLDSFTWQQDQIGTPYTVKVKDSTLTNGIVTLRNRDTTLSEYLHISEILKTVQRHLHCF